MKLVLSPFVISIFYLVFIPYKGIGQTSPFVNKNKIGIQFESKLSWEQIKQKAQTENKFIFVDCYASWCGPCKLMDKTTYLNDNVVYYMNDKFIAVKLQLDTSNADDASVKRQYETAHYILEKFKVNAFPTFLFFSPEGLVIHRDLGYKSSSDFITLIKTALDPRKQFYTLVDEYLRGSINYKLTPHLAMTAKELGNIDLANKIAKDCKYNYLDKLDSTSLLTSENLKFINTFPELGNSGDGFFNLYFKHRKQVDSIMNFDSFSGFEINYIISREEVYDKIMKDGKFMTSEPDWRLMYSNISRKYNVMYADDILLVAQIDFYQRTGKWTKYVECVERLLKKKPPKRGETNFSKALGTISMIGDDSWGLNFVAYNVFLNCFDKKVLNKALKWSEQSIRLISQPDTIGLISQYLDTKGNILYKLGRVGKAIEIEEKVLVIAVTIQIAYAKKDGKTTIDASSFDEEISTLKKIKAGRPTWHVN
jgi:thioredoxin-related protein